MKLFPLYAIDGSGTHPLGLPMCQNRLAVPMWSYAMEVLPPARIIELGSYSGGFAIALGVHAYRIGARVISYERSRAPMQELAALGRFLGVVFRDQVDLWECETEIAELIAGPGTSYVLCDGGSKPRELAVFAQYLKPGDVIAAHDYDAGHALGVPDLERPWPWGEISKGDGDAVALVNDLEPWMQEHFDLTGWLAYRRKLA